MFLGHLQQQTGASFGTGLFMIGLGVGSRFLVAGLQSPSLSHLGTAAQASFCGALLGTGYFLMIKAADLLLGPQPPQEGSTCTPPLY